MEVAQVIQEEVQELLRAEEEVRMKMLMWQSSFDSITGTSFACY